MIHSFRGLGRRRETKALLQRAKPARGGDRGCCAGGAVHESRWWHTGSCNQAILSPGHPPAAASICSAELHRMFLCPL